MPGRLYNHLLQCADPLQTLVAGSFVTVGSGNPTVTKGSGFSVVRDSAGKYTVTVTGASGLVAVLCNVHVETTTNATTQELEYTSIDQDTITGAAFQVWVLANADTSGAATAVADDTGSEVHFIAVVQQAT